MLTAAFDRAHDHSDAAISITRGDTPSCGESRHTSARASAAVSIIVGDPGTRARPDWIGLAFSALRAATSSSSRSTRWTRTTSRGLPEIQWRRWMAARAVTCRVQKRNADRCASSPPSAPPPTGLTLARRLPAGDFSLSLSGRHYRSDSNEWASCIGQVHLDATLLREQNKEFRLGASARASAL